ncbi:hypothetical protein EMIT0P100_50060 [Pseudomonas sp. IT-P100]
MHGHCACRRSLYTNVHEDEPGEDPCAHSPLPRSSVSQPFELLLGRRTYDIFAAAGSRVGGRTSADDFSRRAGAWQAPV